MFFGGRKPDPFSATILSAANYLIPFVLHRGSLQPHHALCSCWLLSQRTDHLSFCPLLTGIIYPYLFSFLRNFLCFSQKGSAEHSLWRTSTAQEDSIRIMENLCCEFLLLSFNILVLHTITPTPIPVSCSTQQVTNKYLWNNQENYLNF